MGSGIVWAWLITVFLIAVLFSEGWDFKKLTSESFCTAEEKENMLLFMLPFKSSGKEMVNI